MIKPRTIKRCLVLGVVLCIPIFAVVRVAPYMRSPRSQTLTPDQRAITRIVKNSVVPVYELEMSNDEENELAHAISQVVKTRLLQLPIESRPSDSNAAAIASVYAEFVLTNRTGTLNQYLRHCEDESYKPRKVLVQDDVSKSEKAWMYSTAWAKHKAIDPDAITCNARFINGQQIETPRFEAAAIKSRPLSTGVDVVHGRHPFTVYEMIHSVIVPNLDGKSEFGVKVCVSIANDGSRGKWGVVSTTWSDKPDGSVFRLPYP